MHEVLQSPELSLMDVRLIPHPGQSQSLTWYIVHPPPHAPCTLAPVYLLPGLSEELSLVSLLPPMPSEAVTARAMLSHLRSAPRFDTPFHHPVRGWTHGPYGPPIQTITHYTQLLPSLGEYVGPLFDPLRPAHRPTSSIDGSYIYTYEAPMEGDGPAPDESEQWIEFRHHIADLDLPSISPVTSHPTDIAMLPTTHPFEPSHTLPDHPPELEDDDAHHTSTTTISPLCRCAPTSPRPPSEAPPPSHPPSGPATPSRSPSPSTSSASNSDGEYQPSPRPRPPTATSRARASGTTTQPSDPPSPHAPPSSSPTWVVTHRTPRQQYRCHLVPCPCTPDRRIFAKKVDLIHHYVLCYPPKTLPQEAIDEPDLYRCNICHKIYATAGWLNKHTAKVHVGAPLPCPQDTRSVARIRDNMVTNLPSPSAIASNVDGLPPPSAAISSNLPFLQSHPPSSTTLDEVHTNALPTPPPKSVAAVDSILYAATCKLVSTPDSDTSLTLILATPRLLLAPPAASTPKSELPATVRHRCARLRTGSAADLWDEYDWKQALMRAATPVLRRLDPATMASYLNRVISKKSPASAWKILSAAPFIPPIAELSHLLHAKIHSSHSPYLDPSELPAQTSNLLPRPPFPKGWLLPADMQHIADKTRRQLTSNSVGAPCATGLTTKLLIDCPDTMTILGLWLRLLRLGRVTSEARLRYVTKLSSGQCKINKKLDPPRMPDTVEEVNAVRPLSRHIVVRRHNARHLSRRHNTQHRPTLEAQNQYGSSPNGCTAARIFLQLLLHIHPTWAHTPADIKNAHNAISRAAIWEHFLSLAQSNTATTNDFEVLIYFAIHYTIPGRSLIPESAHMSLVHQTRALDQGDGMATPYFNAVYTTLIARALQDPRYKLAIPMLIHNDLTIVAPMAIHRDDEHHAPYTPNSPYDPDLRAYNAEVILYLAHYLLVHADLEMEVDKLHLLHLSSPLQPSLSHYFVSIYPEGITVEDTHYVVGGLAVGTTEGILSFLSKLADKYERTIDQFVSLHGLNPHGALLILLHNLRPNDNHNHHLRGHEPNHTSLTAHRLRHAAVRALASILELPVHSLIHPVYLPHTNTPPAPSDHIATDAASYQVLSPASNGGIGITDPVTSAAPSYLSGFGDSQPLLRRHPDLLAILEDTDAYPSDGSPNILSSAHSVFYSITALTTFLDPALASQGQDPRSCPPSTIMLDSTGRPHLSKLHEAANRGLQATFTRPIHTHTSHFILKPTSTHYTDFDRIRIRACSHVGAYALFVSHIIHPTTQLSRPVLTLLIMGRLGIPLHVYPGISTTALLSCHPRCKLGHTKASEDPWFDLQDPATVDNAAHAHHPLSCNMLYLLTKRHNALLRVLGATLAQISYRHEYLVRENSSSSTTGSATDLVARSPYLQPPGVSIDATVSVAYLPSYSKGAARSSSYLHNRRAAEKNWHHGPGVTARGLQFLAATWTHDASFGPAPTLRWLRTSFKLYTATQLAAGLSATPSTYLYTLMWEQFQASMAKSNSDALHQLIIHPHTAPATRPPARPVSTDTATPSVPPPEPPNPS